jgi:hypothetical protein
MKTSHMESPPASLPITQDLTLAYLVSLVIALLMTVASVAGLLYRAAIYPTDELLLSFLPNDALNLVVGLPILLGSMWLARRGKLIGLLCWPGALFYVLYVYALYVIGMPFNALFLPYILLVPLSAYTIIGIVASIDGEAVRQRLTGVVPARTAGGILAGLAILLIVRQIAIIVAALTSQTPVDTLERMLWIADVTVGCPALLVGGVLLWRRKALGYVAGAGLLLQYGVLAVGLIPVMVFQALTTASPIDVAGIVVVLVMVAICFIPFAFFVRGAASDRSSSPA